ncbi:MAG TPA: cysteine desulfurase family protein [Oligoflexia bacterium]|nr:cysteine desulfurase family protein [Oligoflexia bacterium]
MIYADCNATSPMPASVLAQMLPYLTDEFGNPSSVHSRLGARARDALETARGRVSALIGALPEEIVFLSGGTEASAHALIGAYAANPTKNHIIISAVEHPAVVEASRFLERVLGARVTSVPVDKNGTLNAEAVYGAIEVDTTIISLMLANNETGVVLPVAEAAEIARSRGIVVHTDAVQAAGKMPVRFDELGVDLMSISAHKFGGPKGVGALVVRKGCRWEPVVRGGAQEGGRRGGTQAVALIAAMGEAARLRLEALQNGIEEKMRIQRDRFEREICARTEGVMINGAGALRLPNTASLRIDGVIGEELVRVLGERDVFISAGSACKSGSTAPSPVLDAMGLSTVESLSTIRVSFGVETSDEEADNLVDILTECIAGQRKQSSAVINTKLLG